MNGQWIGVALGGLAPAVLFAAMALLAKASTDYDTGVGTFMLSVSAAVGIVGLFALRLLPLRSVSFAGTALAFLGGLGWAIGAALIAFALLRYSVPISKLGALHNTSALLVAVVGLYVFSEWREVHTVQLLIGASFIVLGGVLVVRA